jgi:NosR/NirI family nitrous oxide reductase transcriptional regulator
MTPTRPRGGHRRAALACLAVLVAGPAGAGDARGQGDAPFSLEAVQAAFPGAVGTGPVEGEPPAAAVQGENGVIGYVFSSRAVVQSTGYSGKPLDLLIGLARDGTIAGVDIVEHHEPILMIGVSDADLHRFVTRFRGHDIRRPMAVGGSAPDVADRIDAVSGATISSLVINDTVLRAARAVAASRGLIGGDAGVDFESYEPASWQALIDDGSIARRVLTVGEVADRFDAAGATPFAPGVPAPPAEASFIALYAALASPARIGRNLIGDAAFNRALARLSAEDLLVFVGGTGLYSFKGTSWRQSGRFDRLTIVQDEREITLLGAWHERIEALVAEGAPALRELALFSVPVEAGLDPTRPWRLVLSVEGRDAAGAPAVERFDLTYRLPARYLRAEAAAGWAGGDADSLWSRNWNARRWQIAILGAGLLVLTGLLVFQDALARRPHLYTRLRTGFLVFTLVWIGWIAGAQLSVINVLTFADAIMTEFHWELFLLEPLIFILWGYVAVTLLFWGRGVFCGWLCPFGALQELINRLARRVRVPQWRLPFGLHERIWPVKYVVFLGLFALFLQDPALAIRGAEVEPFKTAIVLAFDRAWPYLLYVGALLVAGLFVERFFCRYLCPLGAALAIPARIRMFEWLKRRWQCGAPCQQCAQNCPVQAIHPEGRINPNECIHCLHCQVLYFDDTVCPPLIERRKRREARAAQARAQALPETTP